MSSATLRSVPTRFQQRTIDYVIKRFWHDADPARRFLVADEVGLGKTMIAREILSEALKRRAGKSIDIVYLCSSKPVASQNLKRLKVQGHGGTTKSTRLTLLALEPRGDVDVRYFALTPDTSFKVTGKSGLVRERALIFRMLAVLPETKGLTAALQQVSDTSWQSAVDRIPHSLDPDIVESFRQAVINEPGLLADIKDFGEKVQDFAPNERLPKDLKKRRDGIVGMLRRHLALQGAQAMASNGLVIVDEFQRFASLFDRRRIEIDIAVKLVDRLLSHEVQDRRVLLLSATPYRIPGADIPANETPYTDFIALIRFLADEKAAARLSEALDRYGLALRTAPHDPDAITAARDEAAAILQPIMCRTERTGAGGNPNAMVREEEIPLDSHAHDLAGAMSARRISRRLKVRDPVEYWKSAPFFLEFMREYQFREAVVGAPTADRPFVMKQAKAAKLVLDKQALRRFDPLDQPPSARLRHLIEQAIPKGAERLLWLPPSLEYLTPGASYATAKQDLKRLIFTEWRLAPDAIAALTSYVVEQRLDEAMRASFFKHKRRTETGGSLRHTRFGTLGNMLRLGRARQTSDDATLAMAPLLLLLPGRRMAECGDPLPHAIAARKPVAPIVVMKEAAQTIRAALKKHTAPKTGRIDERWYWAAPLLIEGTRATNLWLGEKDPFLSDKEVAGTDFERVREAIKAVIDNEITLGRKPRDLVQILAKAAVSSPANCAYRALRRTASSAVTDAQLRRAAFHIARGFQSLFNQHEAAAAVQLEYPGRKRVFWQQTLDYCLGGNLQAVLDEHLHFEADGLAMFDGSEQEKLQMAAVAVHRALTLHRASIDVRGFEPRRKSEGGRDDVVRLRCRHGARFADIKEESGEISRLDAVRGAFNSPFRPFVLASTAVGQEGLDFHPWCHAIVHWNLPKSPVELEQREGRVHRYKGHAVRLNIAKAIGLPGLTDVAAGDDPWRALFDAAALVDEENELSPFWLFEPDDEAVKIRRIIPFLRYSREAEVWPRLRNRLATYRLAIGMPRSDDLLDVLERNGVTAEMAATWKIDLRPPRMTS